MGASYGVRNEVDPFNMRGPVISYRIVAIDDRTADSVRTTGRSPRYGHPAHAEVATGHGPCRQCLHTFAVGSERRILFTYDAFESSEELPLPGPVFIHEEKCERYPETGGFPPDLVHHRLTLNAYARGRRLLAQEYVAGGAVEHVLQRLLGDPVVDYIHVRDTQAGCYDFRIERNNGDNGQRKETNSARMDSNG